MLIYIVSKAYQKFYDQYYRKIFTANVGNL